MTLVEALIGTAMLGTLLASILIARGRLSIQSRRAIVRVQACAVLDELMATWWSDHEKLPRNGSGDVPEKPGWRWRTRIVPSEQAEALGAQVVAVEVFEADSDEAAPPGATVEILLAGKADDEAVAEAGP